MDNWTRHGWGGTERLRASLSIARVERIMRDQAREVFEPFRLTHARHEALGLLFFSRNGELQLRQLGLRLMLHPTSVTSTVDALEELGYVERVPDPNDRRATLARITEGGRQAFAASAAAVHELAHGLSALSEADAAELSRLLRAVREAAGDIVAAAPEPQAPDPTPPATARRGAQR